MNSSDNGALFKSWLTAHQGIVLKVARAYSESREECEDLAQEILLQVWRSLPKFEERARESTWIYRVALNTALAWKRKERLRRRKRRQGVSFQEIPNPGGEERDPLVHRETVARLYEAIRRLRSPDGALILMWLDELSSGEMAQVLGIAEPHVRVKLSRARQRLAELLQEARDES